jgi:hypothetical protein
MPTITTFQNGQVLESSALTTAQMDTIFQLLLNQILGVVCGLNLFCSLINQSNVISTPLFVGRSIANGFEAVGPNLPIGTTITNLSAVNQSLVITLSNQAELSIDEPVTFNDPVYNTRVRTSWEQKGAPGFAITDDTLFIQCVLTPTNYNLRDENYTNDPNNEDLFYKNRSYTRLWRVGFVAYGPNSFDSIRLIKSMLLEDFPHDTLAAYNLYLVPDSASIVRNPELFENQWWERVDYAEEFNEEVNESITMTRVKSVDIIGTTNDKINFEVTVQGG